MIPFFALLWLSIASPDGGRAAYGDEPELSLSYRASDEKLTTERLWALDPRELNPHRSRWAVKRVVKIEGLEALELPRSSPRAPAQYEVRFQGLLSSAEGLIRGPGPWYLDSSKVPCADDPHQLFGNETGARVAVDEAGKIWGEVLRDERSKLVAQFRQIRAARPHWALNRAVQVYTEWLRSTEAIWRTRAFPAARASEWRSYAASGLLKNCSKKPDLPTWREMLEPVPAVGEIALKPRLRAPARRWDGAFSLRADAVLSDVRLTGQMLIDSGAPQSIASPDWLASQGFPSNLIEVPGIPPERYSFTAGQTGAGFGKRIQVDGMRISGENFVFTDFVLADTELFGAPTESNSCCDAILGADFLARNVVELSPGAPGRAARPTQAGSPHIVRVWPREGFVPPASVIADPVWVEAYFSKDRLPTSDCDAISVHWLTGSEAAWTGKFPAAGAGQAAAAARTQGLTLRCAGLEIVQGLRASDAVPSGAEPSMIPGVGMPVLGRGPVIFDLPHGRIWFSRSALSRSVLRNESGLTAEFVQKGEARLLRVTRIVPGSPAAKLAKQFPKDQSLLAGARVLALDGMAVDELDEWDVNQILSGARTSIIKVEWIQQEPRTSSGKPRKPRSAELNVGRYN